MKRWMILLVALVLVAGLVVVLGSRPDERVAASASDSSRAPVFEVRVEKPRLARPFFGLLPSGLEAQLAEHGDLGFDHSSRDAEIGEVGSDHLELRAEGWELFLETQGEEGVTLETHLVFPMMLAGEPRRLRCHPEEGAYGELRTSSREGSDEIDGRFRVELAVCENLDTGKTMQWPPAPLTVRGSFEGLPRGRG